MSKFVVKGSVSNVVEIEVEAETAADARRIAQTVSDDAWLEAVDNELDFEIDVISVTEGAL